MIVLIKGAGDLASGVAHRLVKSGFKVVMTEISDPTMVRRTVSYGEAIYQGSMSIDGITAKSVDLGCDFELMWAKKEIPVLVDPDASCIDILHPHVIVDGIIAKKNTGTYKDQAPLTIGLGPGFNAGADVDLVIETMRGHNLGRVICKGFAQPNTGVPGEIGGHSIKRLLKAPAEGIFIASHEIGDHVQEGTVIGRVGNTQVQTEIAGILRGLIKSGITVYKGMKIGDVDPRATKEYCFTISDKARAIAGGVLEAILSFCDEKTLQLEQF